MATRPLKLLSPTRVPPSPITVLRSASGAMSLRMTRRAASRGAEPVHVQELTAHLARVTGRPLRIDASHLYDPLDPGVVERRVRRRHPPRNRLNSPRT